MICSYPRIKAIFDFSFALLLIVLFSPLFLILCLAVFIFLGSPILFVQHRPGHLSAPFPLLKFRTMRDIYNSDGTILPDSARMTRFGSILRRSSLDELPALINILRGEMSFIGPRPLLLQYLPLYSPEQTRRHNVMPGFSGWAQINGRNSLSWEDKFRLDVWYVDHQSFALDLRIFFITVWKVLSRQGITSDGSVTSHYFTGSPKL